MPIVRKNIEDVRISAKRMRELEALSDEDIDYSDIPELDEEWFKKARVRYPAKQQVTLRLDGDIVRFFKTQGKGYQTRINAALRAFMNAVIREEEATREKKRASS